MFKLIKQARSDNDKSTKYDVVLDKEYTVEEFIDAIADGRNGTYGQITIKNDKEAIESFAYNIESIDYRHCRLQNAEEKIKQVWADGVWLKINYTILLENKRKHKKVRSDLLLKNQMEKNQWLLFLKINPMTHIHLLI